MEVPKSLFSGAHVNDPALKNSTEALLDEIILKGASRGSFGHQEKCVADMSHYEVASSQSQDSLEDMF